MSLCLSMEEYDLDSYSEIKGYLGEFKVDMKNDSPRRNSRSLSIASAMSVFRKKSLSEIQLPTNSSNIYEHNIETPELDKLDSTKSKNSCGRCRKLKRKCSRDMPECSSCASSDKLCIYIPRKSSTSTGTNPSSKVFKLLQQHQKSNRFRSSLSSSSVSSGSSNSSIGDRSRSNSHESINLELIDRARKVSQLQHQNQPPQPLTPKMLPCIFKPMYQQNSITPIGTNSANPTTTQASVNSGCPIKLPSIQDLINSIPKEAGIPKRNGTKKDCTFKIRQNQSI